MKQFYALTMKNKKVTLITLSLVIIFLLSSLVTYKTFVRQYLFNDYVVYQSRELSNENIAVHEENKDLRFENEEQKELIDRIKRIATSNAYNNEKVILGKIKELISDAENQN